MIKNFTLAIFLLSSIYSIGQGSDNSNVHFCGEHTERNKLYLENPGLEKQDKIEQEDFQKKYVDFLKTWSPADRASYTIPVVVHVVHLGGAENITTTQIKDAITQLNKDFNKQNSDLTNTVSAFQNIIGDADISFKLATKDPLGNCHSGITRTNSPTTNDVGMSNGGHPIVDAVAAEHGIWPQKMYMSVFVCSEPNGNAGYTFRPSSFFPSSQMYGAIFMRYDYMGLTGESQDRFKHTLSHEVGHWLNLPHLWGKTNNPGIQSNCNDDDDVTDTPNTIGWQSCNLTGTSCNSLDNVQNIMEYSYCSTMFTQGQAAKMQAALASSPSGRDNLHTSTNLRNTGVINPSNTICKAEFMVNKTDICPGGEVEFSDISVHNVTGRKWTFNGGFPLTSTDSLVKVVYDTPGDYSVTLEVFNAIDNKTTILNNVVRVLNTNSQTFPYSEGFEAISNLETDLSFSTENESNDKTWEISHSQSYEGSKCTVLKNFYNQVEKSKDALISSAVDLSSYTPEDDVMISFKYAYAKKDPLNDEWLKVFISKDCGETWLLRKIKHGNSLGDKIVTSFYLPEDQDWETITVSSIPDSYLVTSFRFKLEFTGDLGNNIYVDNINIYSPHLAELNSVELDQKIKLYPNPVSENSILNITGYQNLKVDVNLYNVTGELIQTLYSGYIQGASKNITFDNENIARGIYYISLDSDYGNRTLKMIKQ